MNFINQYVMPYLEEGIPFIKTIGREYNEAIIYFHIDLDGVTSAIGMRSYLEKYGIKTIQAIRVQYGDQEFNLPKPDMSKLHVMVDFAHGKPFVKIHTDHHDGQAGVAIGTSTSFKHNRSNAETISREISNRDLFPTEDIKYISMVDSADFAKENISVDDVTNLQFNVDKTQSLDRNKKKFALVVNKSLLSYKNKPNFLEYLVLNAQPSLMSIYNNIIKYCKENNLEVPSTLQSGTENYQQQHQDRSTNKDVRELENGESTLLGNLIVQYGGGNMLPKSGMLFDRYTPFKTYPQAHYFLIMWPMGLIQLSANPFIDKQNPYHLGEIILGTGEGTNKTGGLIDQFKSQLKEIKVTLNDLKWANEKKLKQGSIGLGADDIKNLFGENNVKGIGLDKKIIQDIMSRPLSNLSFKQKDILKKSYLSAWDVILSQSGGHKNITNLTNLSFLPTDLQKDIFATIADAIKKL